MVRWWRRAAPSPGPCCWCVSSASYGRGARILSVGIATTGLVTFAYFSLASHTPERGRLQGRLGPVVGPVPDHLDHLPAGRAAALAHDLVAAGARSRGSPAAGAADDPGERGGRVPRRGAGAAGPDPERPLRRLGRAVLGARRRCARVRGELLRARLARRAPEVRPLRRARAARVGLALPVRARRGCRHRGRTGRRCARHRGGAAGVARRRAVGARAQAPSAWRDGLDTRRRGLRGRGAGDHGRRAGAAQRSGPGGRRDGRPTRRSPASCSTCC